MKRITTLILSIVFMGSAAMAEVVIDGNELLRQVASESEETMKFSAKTIWDYILKNQHLFKADQMTVNDESFQLVYFVAGEDRYELNFMRENRTNFVGSQVVTLLDHRDCRSPELRVFATMRMHGPKRLVAEIEAQQVYYSVFQLCTYGIIRATSRASVEKFVMTFKHPVEIIED